MEKKSECVVQQFAIMSSKNETDYTPLHEFTDAEFENVDLKSIAYFYPQDPYSIGILACGQFMCTGQTNVIAHFTPSIYVDDIEITSVIANAPDAAQYIHSCTFVEEMNAYYCENDHLGQLVFEGFNPYPIGEKVDWFNTISSPIYITRADGFNNTLNNQKNIFWCKIFFLFLIFS